MSTCNNLPFYLNPKINILYVRKSKKIVKDISVAKVPTKTKNIKRGRINALNFNQGKT